MLIIRILLISAQLYTHTIPACITTLPPPTKTSPPTKTPTYSSTHGRRVTRSTVTPTLSPIASTLTATAATTTTSASTQYVKGYLAVAIFIYIDMVYKKVTNIVKNI